MQWGSATLAFYGIGAAAVASSVAALRRRLELSQAKHRSLSGHARLARRLARFVPFYEYDAERFFCSDGAPTDVAVRRLLGETLFSGRNPALALGLQARLWVHDRGVSSTEPRSR